MGQEGKGGVGLFMAKHQPSKENMDQVTIDIWRWKKGFSKGKWYPEKHDTYLTPRTDEGTGTKWRVWKGRETLAGKRSERPPMIFQQPQMPGLLSYYGTWHMGKSRATVKGIIQSSVQVPGRQTKMENTGRGGTRPGAFAKKGAYRK